MPKITAPSFSGSPLVFLKEVKAELKKVKWPTRPEVIKMTMIVLGVSIAVGAFIAGLDYLLTNLMGLIIK